MSLSRTFRRSYPHVTAAIEYAEDAIAGRVTAGRYVRLACERQLTDLDRVDFAFHFDVESAERICNYLESLPHIEGHWASRGEKLRLERWQKFCLTTVFGWRRNEETQANDGKLWRADSRRFRTAYEEVPRKNGKTFVAAGVGLYMLEADGEPGAQVYSVATTRKQAQHVFGTARHMAKRATRLDVRAHNINDIATASKFEALHAQGETLDGYNIHCALNDELHAWHKRAVYDVIETGMGARAQPLMFDITTAGNNLEGICFELRGYAVQLLERTRVDESFFAVIYTIDDADKTNWQEPEVWKKANPNWGVSVNPAEFASLVQKAREIPSQQNAFLTKRLNVWVNAAVAWMDMSAWQRCYDPKMKLEDFRGVPCYAGIDLASKIDINSLAIVFQVDQGGKKHYYIFTRHWLPEAAIKSDRFGQYDGWIRMGAITKTPGNVIDTKEIEKDVFQVAEEHKLVEVGVDPGHNSPQIGVNLAQGGITVVDVRPMVMNFSEPMKLLEAWVVDGVLHFCDPVLTWMVSNVVAHRDNKDQIYPRKESAVRKIDGVVASLIAINRLISHGDEPSYQMLFL